MSRRQFFALSSAVGVSAAIPALGLGQNPPAVAAGFHPMGMKAMTAIPGMNGAATSTLGPAVFVKSPPLTKFVQPLRGVFPLDATGIPVAIPDGTVSYLRGKVVAQHYTFDIAQYTDKLHPELPNPTTLWGFHSVKNLGGDPPQRHLGGIIVAEKNVPIQLTFRNRLPRRHPLPVDPTIMGAELAPNRACVHFHGGEVPWISDGGPFAWFRPDDDPADTSPLYGPSVFSAAGNIYQNLNAKLRPGEAEYYYPMNQSARFGWYHDHSMGITRLNAYAGIASALIIRDSFERSLVKLGMPDFIEKGGREIPLVIQDKIFQDEAQDPDYPGIPATGSLWYPYRYTDRWAAVEGSDAGNLPISAIPEMFGDTMLVNGVVHPRVTLEPRRYRLRVLNATQARFLNLQLYQVGTGRTGAVVADFSKPGPDYLVLGTEGGFLARAVRTSSGTQLNVTVDPVTGDRSVDPANPGGSLITGPAERWDLIVDFSNFAGKSLVLFNDTPAPFPGGDSVNDGALDKDPGGNTVLINQLLMRIDVTDTIVGPADPPLKIAHGFPLAADTRSGIRPALSGSWSRITTAPMPNPRDIARVRRLTLNELFDEHGRLIQMLGTNQLMNREPGYAIDPMAPGASLGKTTAMTYMDPVTEEPQAGDLEVWEIANLTADVHPMHFHLVNVQVLGRRPFTDYTFNAAGKGTPVGLGAERGPDATELGWKDTVRMNPGEVTRIAMKFDMAPVPFVVPPSPRTGGNEFVWHCHILEHEEHDMMRPLVVRGRNPRLT
ncbi:MAG: multicopper oxidase domain-containing protein [Actinomycetota bacterium]